MKIVKRKSKESLSVQEKNEIKETFNKFAVHKILLNVSFFLFFPCTDRLSLDFLFTILQMCIAPERCNIYTKTLQWAWPLYTTSSPPPPPLAPQVFHQGPGYKPTGMTGAGKPQRGYHLQSLTDPNLPLPEDIVLITCWSKK